MMKISKRGAIEFSMTTIIIIIIGVAILALALPWIARTMGQVEDITEAAFSAAKEQLRERVGPNDPLIISPEDVTLSAGDQKIVTVAWYNDGIGNQNPNLDIIFTGTSKFDIVGEGRGGTTAQGQITFWKVSVSPKKNINILQGHFESHRAEIKGVTTPRSKPLTIIYK